MPKSTILPFAATTIAVIALSGCTGQHMSVRDVNNHTLVQEGDVTMVPITSQLVSQGAKPVAQIPAELTEYRPDSYRIHPGDTILVTVWDHPELTTPAGSQQQAVEVYDYTSEV